MKSSTLLFIIFLLFLSLFFGCDQKAEISTDDNSNSSGENSKEKPRRLETDLGKSHTPVFPKSPPPGHLYVYDLQPEDSFEIRLLLTSLQGVIAKTEPRIYLYFDSAVDPFWLGEMEDHYGVTWETVDDPWALVDIFASEISGAIVYDPTLLASSNLATTLAGINNAVIAAPQLLPDLAARGINIFMDLRGMFTDNVDMYQWAMVNVWPLSNQTILCFSNPSLSTLRDYLVTHDIFTVMLDPHIVEERALLEDILDQTPQHIPILGWAIDELLGVIIFSRGSKFHVASDWTRNMSVTSGLSAPSLSQDHAAPFGEIENKIYIAFALTDGDNVAYSLEALWFKWNDPARGEIPLGWEVSFNLIDLGPQAIRYYYETRSENDMFVGPACGIGYIYPGHYDDLETFVDMTAPYMKAADMDTIWLINDDLTLPDSAVTTFSQGLDLRGIFIDYWPNLDKGFYMSSNGTPVLRSQYVYLVGPEQIQGIIDNKLVEKEYFYPNSPFFLFIGVNGWATTPTYIKSITDNLDSRFVLLRPDKMFAAMEKAAEEGFVF